MRSLSVVEASLIGPPTLRTHLSMTMHPGRLTALCLGHGSVCIDISSSGATQTARILNHNQTIGHGTAACAVL